VDKLRHGGYDAILLAKAGIDRLGLDLSDLHVQVLDPRAFVPAPAQGALAVQTRADDERTNTAVRLLHEATAALSAECEREVLRAYHGGCQVPLGVHVRTTGDRLTLWASAAHRAEDMPRWIHLEGSDPRALANEMVLRLQALSGRCR
jgi:hydroxymethylbilane synthase